MFGDFCMWFLINVILVVLWYGIGAWLTFDLFWFESMTQYQKDFVFPVSRIILLLLNMPLLMAFYDERTKDENR